MQERRFELHEEQHFRGDSVGLFPVSAYGTN